jgi:hypothetical protein
MGVLERVLVFKGESPIEEPHRGIAGEDGGRLG